MKLDFDERDLRSLRVFCHVASAGGFSAAEKQLPMSKASISRHVRQLEERLNVDLCERGPAGFKLTPEGMLALELASDAFRALSRIRPEIDAAHGVLSGPLIIGIGEHMLAHRHWKLSDALAQLKKLATRVHPEIVVAPFTELDRALREQRVDIAIRGKYQENKDFNYLPLYIEHHRIYISTRISDDVPPHSLPLIYRYHPYVEQALNTGDYVKGPQAGGLDAVAALIATGYYQGILPTYYGALLEKRLNLKIADYSPKFKHVVCAVTQTTIPLNNRVRFFLDILAETHPTIN